jgi:hypothetical protein
MTIEVNIKITYNYETKLFKVDSDKYIFSSITTSRWEMEKCMQSTIEALVFEIFQIERH